MASAQHPIDSALKELRELTESELSGLSRDASKRAAAAAQHSPPGSKASTATGESSSEGQISRIATLSSLEAISELSAQLVEEERWEAALAVVTEEHELMGSMHGEADERTLQVLSVYAGVLWQLGRGRDARDLLDELVSRRTSLRLQTKMISATIISACVHSCVRALDTQLTCARARPRVCAAGGRYPLGR